MSLGDHAGEKLFAAPNYPSAELKNRLLNLGQHPLQQPAAADQRFLQERGSLDGQ